MHKIRIDKFLSTNSLFIKACVFLWSKKVSDLIFIPYVDHVLIKYKHLGINKNIAIIKNDAYTYMLFQLKLFAGLNLVNKNLIQSCSIPIIIDEKKYWFRCSFHPSLNGDSLAIRFVQSTFFQWNESIEFRGLNIIFGTTGSGKSTILYGIMNNFNGHVVSLEDPVEYELQNACQTNVSDIGYDNALKSVLRQCPNMICIGEIRDCVSANAAIMAALTGHCVITTIHASSKKDIINRLEQMGCKNFEHLISHYIYVENFNYKIY